MIYCVDFDGTLLDSSHRHFVVMCDVLKALGKEIVFTEDEYLQYKFSGNSTKMFCLEKMGVSKAESEKIAKLWGSWIEDEKYLEYDVLYDDAEPFLIACKEQDIKLVLLTARKNEQLVKKQVKSIGIEGYFSNVYVVNPSNAMAGKKEIIEQLLNDEEKIVVIGDTEVEHEIVEELNIKGIILNRGFRNKQYWDNQHVKSFEGLPRKVIV